MPLLTELDLFWNDDSTKMSPLTGLDARAFGLIKGLDRSKVGA
jgi:hypothetical protein